MAVVLAAVCLGPGDRCIRRGVEAETVLWRAGDRAATELLAVVPVLVGDRAEFLVGEVLPVAELAPAVALGTTFCGEGLLDRLTLAEVRKSLA